MFRWPQRPELAQFPGSGVRGNGEGEPTGPQAVGVRKHEQLWGEATTGEIGRGSMTVLTISFFADKCAGFVCRAGYFDP